MLKNRKKYCSNPHIVDMAVLMSEEFASLLSESKTIYLYLTSLVKWECFYGRGLQVGHYCMDDSKCYCICFDDMAACYGMSRFSFDMGIKNLQRRGFIEIICHDGDGNYFVKLPARPVADRLAGENLVRIRLNNILQSHQSDMWKQN